MANEWFKTIGGKKDVNKAHSAIIQPYVASIYSNIGYSVGEASTAAQLCPTAAIHIKKEKQYEHVMQLSNVFKVDSEPACAE